MSNPLINVMLNLHTHYGMDKELVSFIHPLGYEHDFGEIKNHFYLGIMGGKFSKRDLKLKDVKTKIYNDTAFLAFSWDFYAVSKETGENIHTKGRETHFLVLRDMMWKINNIHYSAELNL